MPDLGNTLHWNNYSNVLCKYVKKPDYLSMVLKKQAIIPRYVIELVGYLNLGTIQRICFSMICYSP